MVSPGPLPHVRWQSFPGCLHFSVLKTATSGPGLAGIPLTVGACVLVRCAGTHLCTPASLSSCRVVPCVSTYACMCVCAGMWGRGTDTCVDMHKCMRGAGGTYRSPGPMGRDLHSCMTWGVAHVPHTRGPCMCEGRAPRGGLSRAELIATERSRRKQEKGLRVSSSVESPSAWLSCVFPTGSPI